MKVRQVDIVIVGSGSAGLNAMAQAREAGRSFVLINGGTAGTTCARTGVPAEKSSSRRRFAAYTGSRTIRPAIQETSSCMC